MNGLRMQNRHPLDRERDRAEHPEARLRYFRVGNGQRPSSGLIETYGSVRIAKFIGEESVFEAFREVGRGNHEIVKIAKVRGTTILAAVRYRLRFNFR